MKFLAVLALIFGFTQASWAQDGNAKIAFQQRLEEQTKKTHQEWIATSHQKKLNELAAVLVQSRVFIDEVNSVILKQIPEERIDGVIPTQLSLTTSCKEGNVQHIFTVTTIILDVVTSISFAFDKNETMFSQDGYDIAAFIRPGTVDRSDTRSLKAVSFGVIEGVGTSITIPPTFLAQSPSVQRYVKADKKLIRIRDMTEVKTINTESRCKKFGCK